MKKFILYCLAMTCGFFAVLRFYIFHKALPNFREVDPRILLRGGQPSESGISELAKQGIKSIINLRSRPWSRKKVKTIFSFHIPFCPYKPTDQIVIKFLKILNNPLYQPVYVHCFHGADRTGTLCAIYRIVCQNWDKEAAIAEMKRWGLHWWHKNLVDYIRNLDVTYIRSQT